MTSNMLGAIPYTHLTPNSTMHGIDYTTNDRGWRTHTASAERGSGTMFLGCSITVGLGVRVEDSWAHRVWQRSGTRCFWNLAVCGGGIDTASRLFWHWAPLLRPERVYVLSLFEPRREFATDTGYHTVSAHSQDAHDQQSMIRYFQSTNEQHIHGQRCGAWIDHIARDHGVEVCWVQADWCEPLDNDGADGQHPGASWHARVARTVLENYPPRNAP